MKPSYMMAADDEPEIDRLFSLAGASHRGVLDTAETTRSLHYFYPDGLEAGFFMPLARTAVFFNGDGLPWPDPTHRPTLEELPQ